MMWEMAIRLELGLHYKIPYPRFYHVPVNTTNAVSVIPCLICSLPAGCSLKLWLAEEAQAKSSGGGLHGQLL